MHSSVDGRFAHGTYSRGASQGVDLYQRQLPHLYLSSATGFLSFMSGYTVFLGPITGIMITDVSPRAPFIHPCLLQKASLIAISVSIGSYAAHTSMFPQCIDLMEGIGIRVER